MSQQPADTSLSTRRLYSGPRRGDYSDASIVEMWEILRGITMHGRPMLRRDANMLVPVTERKVKRLLQAMAGWGLLKVVHVPGYPPAVNGWEVTPRGWEAARQPDESALKQVILEELQVERERKPKPKKFGQTRVGIIREMLEKGARAEHETLLLNTKKKSGRVKLYSREDGALLAIVGKLEYQRAAKEVWEAERKRELGLEEEEGEEA
jgi:hypothetical protein